MCEPDTSTAIDGWLWRDQQRPVVQQRRGRFVHQGAGTAEGTVRGTLEAGPLFHPKQHGAGASDQSAAITGASQGRQGLTNVRDPEHLQQRVRTNWLGAELVLELLRGHGIEARFGGSRAGAGRGGEAQGTTGTATKAGESAEAAANLEAAATGTNQQDVRGEELCQRYRRVRAGLLLDQRDSGLGQVCSDRGGDPQGGVRG
uniref:(northern house mosquito) hypothetical protein n=1 Tax=Culex pipiens TaxID=7175 RepID=A0A8D8HMA0_CULPI